jgi:hypothetical protein
VHGAVALAETHQLAILHEAAKPTLRPQIAPFAQHERVRYVAAAITAAAAVTGLVIVILTAAIKGEV